MHSHPAISGLRATLQFLVASKESLLALVSPSECIFYPFHLSSLFDVSHTLPLIRLSFVLITPLTSPAEIFGSPPNGFTPFLIPATSSPTLSLA